MTEQEDRRTPLQRWLDEGYYNTCALVRNPGAHPLPNIEAPHSITRATETATPAADGQTVLERAADCDFMSRMAAQGHTATGEPTPKQS